MVSKFPRGAWTVAATALAVSWVSALGAEERLPWRGGTGGQEPAALAQNDAYRGGDDGPAGDDAYSPDDAYEPRDGSDRYGEHKGRRDETYRPGRDSGGAARQDDERYEDRDGYGEPYAPPREGEHYEQGRDYDDGPPPAGTYSQDEIVETGHRFFGSITKGLAGAVEYAFQKAGRPNGYILGQDGGGAFVAGLRYGDGTLYTKYDGDHRVYWQGPSVGYDFGGEGSKTMVLVYNLRDPSEIYHRFGGVEGSAYLVGGVSIQFQKYGDIMLAPIRSGIGLRLGANVGYSKYTRHPTLNPF